MTSPTDRIEKQIHLKATPARVWRAIADAGEFGAWFGVAFDEGTRFRPGERARGRITSPGHEDCVFEILVERVESERLLSFRWHPHAIDPTVDYSHEPTTEVVFTLEPADGGTLLRLVESGFDAVPAARRATAFRMNGEGWAIQMKNIERHVDAAENST